MSTYNLSVKPVCPLATSHTTCHRASLPLALGVWGGHLLFLGLVLFAENAFAAIGTDILLGAEADMLATVKGTARIIFYIIELFVATATYIKTRSPMVFAGTVVLALFFEAFLKIFLDTTV